MAKKINDLFGSMRMVLPDQKAAILEHKSKRGLVKRPFIDEDEFGEMCFRIYDSTQYNYEISIKWFVPSNGRLGTFEERQGVVIDIDATRRSILLDSRWIDIEQLISVTKL